LKDKEKISEKSKGLIGREKICCYLRDFAGRPIGKKLFYKLVDQGLPVEKRGYQWFGHMDQIDQWFLVNPNSQSLKNR